ncbi:hypothetical protein [Nodosilinea sp. E11]|uniref:hypothetical protein n=1 Tax=Nodosilinea sp. E11 TaxID=3037479 RepID=UPI0029350D99|nr:hypothetical protein [Nodosilinea sp. E11]WOD41158.1 hypothetical protein RRF56_10180 [Nodosilinea sp. E11]
MAACVGLLDTDLHLSHGAISATITLSLPISLLHGSDFNTPNFAVNKIVGKKFSIADQKPGITGA